MPRRYTKSDRPKRPPKVPPSVIERYRKGEPCRALAKETGFCEGSIRDAYKGKISRQRGQKSENETQAQRRFPTWQQHFWAYVRTSDSCWLWAGCAYRQPGRREPTRLQGQFSDKRMPGRALLARRVMYRLMYGEIPDGFCVWAKCNTELCVRPDHLCATTQLEHNRDMMKRGVLVVPPVGENRAKLTPGDVLAIREASRLGEGHEAIAARYEVHKAQISRIVRRENWKSVTPEPVMVSEPVGECVVCRRAVFVTSRPMDEESFDTLIRRRHFPHSRTQSRYLRLTSDAEAVTRAHCSRLEASRSLREYFECYYRGGARIDALPPVGPVCGIDCEATRFSRWRGAWDLQNRNDLKAFNRERKERRWIREGTHLLKEVQRILHRRV